MRSFVHTLVTMLMWVSVVFAEDAPKVLKPVERDYTDATVLLIDHASGLLGISYEDEEAGAKPQKASFKINLNEVYVTNTLSHNLEFSQVLVGDHVDVLTLVDASGHETVTDIVDYNRFDEDAR